MEVTKEAFQAWKSDHVTQEIFKIISDLRDSAKDYISTGGTLTSRCEQDTALFVGRIAAYEDILDIKYEDDEVAND